MAGGAYAANYYIAPTGSDSNNGTSTSSPWATFSHAMNVLKPGDTLYLMDGTYNANQYSSGGYYYLMYINTSGTSGNPITITALNKGKANLTCGAQDGDHYAIMSIGSYITIKDLVIYNCDLGTDWTVNSGTATDQTLVGNIIHDVGAPINVQDNCNYFTADSNTIYNFGTPGSNQNHGIYGRGISGTIINNLVYGNLGQGWSIQVGSYGVSPSGTWEIINNTLVGNNNPDHNECITLYDTSFSDLYLFNNICTGANTAMVYGGWNSTWYAEYNLLDSTSNICNSSDSTCTTVSSSNVSHNLGSTAAGFVNAAAGNYTLAAGSAAIGAGTSLYAPAYDITGATRVGYDIGAYEYVSSTQYTITASSGPGGGISPSGPVQVSQGGNQSFMITPNAGYQIAGVTVDGVSVGAVAAYTFSSVSANHTITATFTANTTYTITASAGTGGSISPSGPTIMNQGVNQTYTITPNTGYKIASVTVDGASVGAVATYTFSSVSANHTITATFTANTTYTITASAGTGGSISPSGPTIMNQGVNQTYTITPNTGYKIASVTVDGASVGAVATYTFSSVSANHTIAATFSAITYTITASAGTNGSISPSGTTTLNSGGSQTYTITPNTGYKIAGVTVDGTSVGAVATYTFSSVSANHTIAATFTANTYTITASAGTNGSISPSGTTTLNSGGSQTYTITPNTGYQITSVTVDGASVGAVSSYTFSSVTANHTISATFASGTVSSGTVAAAIHSGGGSYTSTGGIVYAADKDYSGGSATYTTANITGTSDPALYQTQRYVAPLSYNIPLANGNYTVTLKFAEIYWTSAGQRVFNVAIQGTTVATGLDVYAKVGKNAAYDMSFPATVSNGTLSIGFTPTIGNPIINAILVQTAPASTQYTVTASAGTGGSISPSGSVSVNQGASQSFTITPNTGYKIAGVTVDGTSVGAVATYTFSSVSANHTISATFTANTYTITATAGTGGSISPSGTTTLNSGGTQTYTITPNTGYKIAGVTVDGTSVGAVATYTFSNVTANHTIAATFASGAVSGSVAAAINSGGSSYTSTGGIAYAADKYYSGGSATYTTANITGTSDPALYQTQRYVAPLSYNIPLPNGNYTVTLKFAEIYWTSAGQRVFNVVIQGTTVATGLDVYAKVGKNAAYDMSFPATVSNGTLSIGFTATVGNPIINAILVTAN